VGYVVTSRNTENLEILLLRLLGLHVHYVQFRPVIDHPELETSLDFSYLKRYENSRFSVLIEGMEENLVEGNDNLPCVAHSLTTVITADGNVYLCGRLNIHPWFEPMGNVNGQSFRQIWLGKKRRLQARQARDVSFCRENCPRCRITKFNQLLDRLGRTRTRNFI
jgi:radical SAM protein with 4Fe4S-binding SPASM domain